MSAIVQVLTTLVACFCAVASAKDIQVAGSLFVDLDAAHPSASTELWKNRATGGHFQRIGTPKPVQLEGISALMFNSGETNDAFRCLKGAPAGVTGKAPTRSVEVWVLNPEVAFEEPMVAMARRGGPPGTAYNFNYGTAAGHGAVTHWGGPDLGWGQVPAAGEWHHLVNTCDGTTNRVYCDGKQVAMEKLQPRDLNTHPDSHIVLGTGIRADDQPEFGSIRASLALACVRVHDGVLTPHQILNNFLVDSARLGLREDQGKLRFTAAPLLQTFEETEQGLTYRAEFEVRGLPLPKLSVAAPRGGSLTQLAPERYRFEWVLSDSTLRQLDVRVIADNGETSVTANWSVDVEPVKFSRRLLAVDTNECCDIADVNRDGQLDVIAGRNWFAGPDFRPRPLRAIGEFGKDYSNNNGDHAWDVNGDGWTDVIAGSFKESEVFWFENPGREGLEFGRQWKTHLLLDTEEGENELTFFHDLDVDGTPEYVVNSWNPNRAMLGWRLIPKGDIISLDRLEIHPAGKNHNGHGMGFGDINGDGLEDIVYESGWYERPAGDPFSEPWKRHADWHHAGSSCPIIVRDLNNDGRNDMILGRGHDYGLYWMEQLNPAADGTTKWKQHLIDDSFSQSHALHWVDIDADGHGELVTGKRVRAHSGGDPGAGDVAEMYCYRWYGRSQAFVRYTISSGQVGTGLQIRDGDLNGDGLADLVVSGKSGTFLLFNEGPVQSDADRDSYFRPGDRVVLIGNGLIERDQRFGFLETQLTRTLPHFNLQFRNLGWVGDTVFGHSRAPGRTGSVFGTKEQGYQNLLTQVRDAKPGVLIVGYGFNEAYAGETGLNDFHKGVDRLLTDLRRITSRIVVLSPHLPPADLIHGATSEADIRAYASVLEAKATEHQLKFVSLLGSPQSKSDSITRFGTALTEAGYLHLSTTVSKAFGIEPARVGLICSADSVSAEGARVSEYRWKPNLNSVLEMELQPDVSVVAGDLLTVQISGMSQGNYEIRVGEQSVRLGSADDLSRGVRVRLPPKAADVLNGSVRLRQTINHKNRLYFHSWRPRNTAFITGERKSEQQPSHGDVPLFVPLVVEQERLIAQLKHPRRVFIRIVPVETR